MDQLVVDRRAELIQRPAEGNQHAAPAELGESGHPFGKEDRRHVRLLEILVAAVDDERDRLLHLIDEETPQAVIPLFGHREGDPREVFFLRIEVEPEVLALEHIPVEPRVLDLVLSEDQELSARQVRQGDQERYGDDRGESPGGHPQRRNGQGARHVPIVGEPAAPSEGLTGRIQPENGAAALRRRTCCG